MDLLPQYEAAMSSKLEKLLQSACCGWDHLVSVLTCIDVDGEYISIVSFTTSNNWNLGSLLANDVNCFIELVGHGTFNHVS